MCASTYCTDWNLLDVLEFVRCPEFARCPYRILQINYVDVDVDVIHFAWYVSCMFELGHFKYFGNIASFRFATPMKDRRGTMLLKSYMYQTNFFHIN